MRPVRQAARALLSGLFVVSGLHSVRNPDPLTEHAAPVTDRVGPQLTRLHPKLPSDARTLVRLNGAAQIVGGLLLNTRANRAGAALLAGTLLPTTVAGHHFWNVEDPAQRAAQRTQFLKNASILGGLLLATVDTQGAPGVPWRTRHAVHSANQKAHRRLHEVRSRSRLAVRAANVGRHLPG